MADKTADVIIVGGGSGGYAAALRAAELGKSVVLVEKDKLGGTCLHRGCVPTKALLHVAETADAISGAASLGLEAQLSKINPDAIAAFREGIVSKKHKGLESLIAARGITVVHGTGILAADRGVVVGDDVYRGENVILAMGSYTRSLPGLDLTGRVLSSEAALELREVPQSVIVLGGGVIGVEFASMWRSLGAEVTIIEAFDRLAPNEDAALSKGLERAFRRRGITSKTGARFASATQDESSVTVTLEDGTEISADYLLVAVGRGPATSGLEDSGVQLDRGFVSVDADLRTSVDGVWAVGDIVPGLQLAHRGFQHGIHVAEKIAGLNPVLPNERSLPRITYSHPELASVGVTETTAKAELGDDRVTVFEYNLAGNARSEILGTGGLVKVVREKDGPVIGVHMIGDRVGELITEGQLAISWEAHPEDIAPLIHAHPTQSEALGEAFLALAGKALHTL